MFSVELVTTYSKQTASVSVKLIHVFGITSVALMKREPSAITICNMTLNLLHFMKFYKSGIKILYCLISFFIERNQTMFCLYTI